MILNDAVEKAQAKYFDGAVTDADYMERVMGYYKKHLNLLKMATGGLRQELGSITNRYKDYNDDEHVIEWAGAIKRLFVKKKVIKSTDFDPVEYLAVNYIAGSHGSSKWAS